MSTTLTVNGVGYSFPQTGEDNWGDNVTNWASAVTTGMLQKSGGTFTLTAEVDFGATYGLKSAYFKSRATNPASAGQMRLGNTETIKWRNAANSGDLALTVSASDVLTFNSLPVSALALGSADTVLRMNSGGTAQEYAKIVNANVDSSAAIAYSKLNLGTSIVNADVSGSAAIAYSKLNLSGSILNADINSSAAIAYSKLNLATSIVNADVSGSAAIAYSKLNLATSIVNADVSGSAAIAYSKLNLSTSIVNADISASAAIVDTKLDTISTAGKVSNSATTATTSNTASAIVARDSNGAIVTPNFDQYADFDEESAPSTPSAGKVRVYAKTDKKLYRKTSDGTEAEVGSGGSSGINYISNSDFESNAVTGYATYADAAATTPVDGTGGSANITFASSSSSPLRGTYNGLITKDAANRQGQGVSYDFTIAAADKSRPLSVTFEGEASANYTGSSGSEYMAVYIYDVTNATLIYPQTVNVPAGTSKFTTSFIATTSTSYRLILHIAGTGTSAWTYKLDTVSVSPNTVLMGAAASDWIAYTPTFTGFGTATSIACFYRRVGDTIDIRGTFTSGTCTAVAARISLPTGLTFDSTKITLPAFVGGSINEQSTSTNGVPTVAQTFIASGQTTNISFTNVANGTNGQQLTEQTGTGIFGNSTPLSFTASGIPIATWSANVQMADRAVEEYAYNTTTSNATDTTSFGYGAVGSLIPSVATSQKKKRVRFQSPIQTTDRIEIEFKTATGAWTPVYSFFDGSGITVSPYVYQNTNDYGIAIQYVNSTDIDVVFGIYASPTAATYGGAGQAWSGLSASYWRVRKVSSGAAVGYPIQSSNIVGVNDASTSPSGYVGEYKESKTSGASTWSGATATYFNALTLSLTPGDWDISANVCLQGTGTGMSAVKLGISTDSTAANFSDISRDSMNVVETNDPSVPGTTNGNIQIPSYRVNISTTTTYYLKLQQVYGGGTPTFSGIIRARRMR